MLVLAPALLLVVFNLFAHGIGEFADAMRTIGGNYHLEPQAPALLEPYGWAGLLVLVFYEPVMVARWGATVGKLAMGIRVVACADGKPVTWGRSWARAALPTAAGVLTFGVGWLVVWIVLVLSLVSGPSRRGWHDRLAGTVVVVADSRVRRGRSVRRRVRNDSMDERWQAFMNRADAPEPPPAVPERSRFAESVSEARMMPHAPRCAPMLVCDLSADPDVKD